MNIYIYIYIYIMMYISGASRRDPRNSSQAKKRLVNH